MNLTGIAHPNILIRERSVSDCPEKIRRINVIIIHSMENKEESFNVKGDELLKKFKELVREGNIRKITIKDKDGKVLAVFPLTVGVVGALLAPVLAAVGALAALVTECTISVEKENAREDN